MRPDPGLDLTVLRSLTRPAHDEQQLLDRIHSHLAAHDGYAAFSGGKDSLVVLHLALQVEPNLPVVFFDSGLEFPETHDYLNLIADHLPIPDGVHRYPAEPGLLDLLMADGSWNHTSPLRSARLDLRAPLIDRPARRAHADHGPGVLWGIRDAESAGRRHAHRTALHHELDRNCHGCCSSARQQRHQHGGLITRRDGTVAYSPIWNWTTDQVWEYIARHKLPVNTLYARLRELGAPEWAHRVTSILDANQIQAGRLVWLRRGWPAIYQALLPALPRLREAL